jgi:hypothetical protein
LLSEHFEQAKATYQELKLVHPQRLLIMTTTFARNEQRGPADCHLICRSDFLDKTSLKTAAELSGRFFESTLGMILQVVLAMVPVAFEVYDSPSAAAVSRKAGGVLAESQVEEQDSLLVALLHYQCVFSEARAEAFLPLPSRKKTLLGIENMPMTASFPTSICLQRLVGVVAALGQFSLPWLVRKPKGLEVSMQQKEGSQMFGFGTCIESQCSFFSSHIQDHQKLE